MDSALSNFRDVISSSIIKDISPTEEDRNNFRNVETLLDKGKKEAYEEASLKVLNEKIQNEQQNRHLRKKFANKSFVYLYIVSGFVAFVIMLHGAQGNHFTLPNELLVTLAGGTFASAVGLAGFVVKGLFSPKEAIKSKPKK